MQDQTGEIFRRAKDTVRSIHAEARKAQDADRRKELLAHATNCESRGRMRAMISLAETESGIPVSPDVFDTDPWLLNLENGTVDLDLLPLRAPPRASCKL